jgi:hypothetical protein
MRMRISIKYHSSQAPHVAIIEEDDEITFGHDIITIHQEKKVISIEADPLIIHALRVATK